MNVPDTNGLSVHGNKLELIQSKKKKIQDVYSVDVRSSALFHSMDVLFGHTAY